MNRKENEKGLVDYMTSLAEMDARLDKALPQHRVFVRSTQQLILEHGRFWTPLALPLGAALGARGNCFVNASHLAFERKHLTYCEGYGLASSLLRKGFQMPMLHAWCVDQSGRVIDSTWDEPEDSVYYGLPFLTSFLKRVLIKYKWYGIIETGVLQRCLHPPEEWLKSFPPPGGKAIL